MENVIHLVEMLFWMLIGGISFFVLIGICPTSISEVKGEDAAIVLFLILVAAIIVSVTRIFVIGGAW